MVSAVLVGLGMQDVGAISADGVSQNDAGSGGDAGDSRSTATSILLGSYTGKLVPNDQDWYVAQAATTSLTCVEASAAGDHAGWLVVGAESGSNGRKASARFAPGVTARAGVAAPTLDRAVAGLVPSSSQTSAFGYQFTLGLVGVPDPSVGDALSGTDASSTLSGALAVTTPCFGGRLNSVTGSVDSSDAYKVTAAKGDVITYSLAASLTAVQLSLVDSAGNAIGPTITSGQSAESPQLSSGTYFLLVSSGTLDAAAYLVGMAVGPPDPNGCRPYC